MDIKDFSELIKSQSRDLDKFMRRQLPIKVGRMAKDHYQENFRQGGFVNRGLQSGLQQGDNSLAQPLLQHPMVLCCQDETIFSRP